MDEAAPSSFDSPSETCARAGLRTDAARATPPSGSSHEVSVPFSALSRSNRRPSHRMGPSPLGLSQTPRGFILVLPCSGLTVASHPALTLCGFNLQSLAPPKQPARARRRASPARSWASETTVAGSCPRGLTLQGVSRSGIRVASASCETCDRCSLGFSVTSAVLPSLPWVRHPPLTALDGVTHPALSVSQQTPWRFPPKWEPTTLVFLALP